MLLPEERDNKMNTFVQAQVTSYELLVRDAPEVPQWKQPVIALACSPSLDAVGTTNSGCRNQC